MISALDLLAVLRRNDVSFFTGVPDSLLRPFCDQIAESCGPGEHVIAANEGAAIAIAAGHFLASGRPAMVYMQNSGIGNAVNPLLSLADPEVYATPMILLVGWRGEPGTEDEPQHAKQGRVMVPLLEALEIPHEVLTRSPEALADQIARALRSSKRRPSPMVLLVRAGTFAANSTAPQLRGAPTSLRREDAIETLVQRLTGDYVLVSTTGMASRELFEVRERTGRSHDQDFLTVGSMGHCSQIALGIALKKRDTQVICLDGDGSVIMHMGALAIIGTEAPSNFKHIVLNNWSHDSVGGQPTAAGRIDLPAIARGCGYADAWTVTDLSDLDDAIVRLEEQDGPLLLEVVVRKGSRPDLGRPHGTPLENRQGFMAHLRKTS